MNSIIVDRPYTDVLEKLNMPNLKLLIYYAWAVSVISAKLKLKFSCANFARLIFVETMHYPLLNRENYIYCTHSLLTGSVYYYDNLMNTVISEERRCIHLIIC